MTIREGIVRAMRQLNVSRTELAQRMGVSKANVTQLLATDRNMTVRSMANVCEALGVEVTVSLQCAGKHPGDCWRVRCNLGGKCALNGKGSHG